MHDFLEEKPDGAPEWMVSYADMITIVMSFFVVMFSIASGEAAKGKRTTRQDVVFESLEYRFGPKWKPFANWSLMPGNSMLPGDGKGLGSHAPTPAVGDPGGTVRVLKVEKARIRVPGQGDLIAIGGMVHFEKGGASLTPGQNASLQKIADELAGKPQEVEIVATASSHPLSQGSAFADRWELGYARCRQTAELLVSLKVEQERLRLSVIPASAHESKGTNPPEADTAVRVYLSTTLPTGVK